MFAPASAPFHNIHIKSLHEVIVCRTATDATTHAHAK